MLRAFKNSFNNLKFLFIIFLFELNIQCYYGEEIVKTVPEEIRVPSNSFYEKFRSMTKRKPNLISVTWAHAVNSKQKLFDALHSEIDMIEADIVIGKLDNGKTLHDIPIMAHPPSNVSDIGLRDFLNQIMLYNSANAYKQKGIKLDFKSIEAFEKSINILNNTIPMMTFPIWLNADIVRGPINEQKIKFVDPKRFLTACKPFKQAILSIGWTTEWGSDYYDTHTGYTWKYINDMVTIIKNNELQTSGQEITFPVRAGIAAHSLPQLQFLLRMISVTNPCTLTIWSSPNDHIDVIKLRKLIETIGYEHVYLDVPDELSNSLNLGCYLPIISASALPFLGFSIISACFIIVSMWYHKPT